LSVAVPRLLGLLGIIAAVAALYWPTTASYAIAWTDFNNLGNTHGFVILGMCLAFLWLRRKELATESPRLSVAACLALAGASLVWLLAYRASIQTFHQLWLPVVLWTAIYAAYGRANARTCLFAVGFLYFAVPVWGYLAGPLQALTILVTRLILRGIGVPVHFDGILVQIPEGTFAIEGGCSGVHFFVVALAIAAYYGAVHRDRLRNRALLLILAAALALLTNWIRVSTIITAGHVTAMQSYLVRVSHYGFGWTVFAVAMSGFFLIASRIPLQPANDGAAPAPAAGEGLTSPAILGLPLLIAAMVLGPALAWAAARRDVAVTAAPIVAASVLGWEGPFAGEDLWQPLFIGADSEMLARYQHGSTQIEWYTAAYRFQRQGKKLLGYDNSITGVDSITILGQDVVTVAGRRFVDVHLEDMKGVQYLLWYVYEIGTLELTSGLRAQLWYGAASLAHPIESRIIGFRAKCDPDCAAAGAALALFTAAICDNASRFDNCWQDRRIASDKLKKTPIPQRDESR
jgi:exosortase